MSVEKRTEIILFLSNGSKNGVLQRGQVQQAATKIQVSRGTIYLLWKRYKNKDENLFVNKKKGNVGRKSSLTNSQIQEKIKAVPHGKRTTLRSLSEHANIPLSTLHRNLKNGLFKRVSTKLKPLLTEKNMLDRVKFSLSHLIKGRDDFFF